MIQRYITYILFATLILFVSCNKEQVDGQSLYEEEATQIVSNTNNTDTLAIFANKYANLHDKKAEAIIRESLGKKYRDLSDFSNAIIQHDSAIALSSSIKDTLHWVRALNQQGTNFRRMGDMEEASKLHYKALELCESHKQDTTFNARKNRVVSLNGLGNVLLSMGNYDEARKVFQEALKGEESLGSLVGQAINYANLGSIFERNGRLDSARTYYNKSMEMNSIASNNVGIGLCYQYLGKIDEEEGNLSQAKNHYQKSYEVLVPTNDSWHWMEASISLSRLYLNTNTPDSAYKYIEITHHTAQGIKSKEHLAQTYLLKSQYEEKWGSSIHALNYFKLSHELSDSVLSEKNFNKIQNLRVNYEAKRRAIEVEQAKEDTKAEQRIRRAITWASIAALIIMLIIMLSLLHVNAIRKKSNETLTKANEAMKKADEELRKADSELRKADEELRLADSERQAFYRDIAHKLRTPLTVVIGMTQQLNEHIDKNNEQAQGDFSAVRRQNNELLRLVNEMMHKLEPNASTATVIEGETQEENADLYSAEESLGLNDPLNDTFAIPNEDGTRPLILLAEDNEDVARYQCELLESNGYRVNWAEDGLIALKLIKEEMPRLVITDVMMPNMDGLELCKRIRNDKEINHLPLIIVTARVEDRDRMKGLEAGAEVYLTKPFLGKELLINIKNLLTQREKLRLKYADETATNNPLNDDSPINAIEESEEAIFKKKVDEVIDSNITDTSFNSLSLASQLCFSRSQLNRRMNAILGIDTTHYIRERRLERACSLLKRTDMTIMDVQIACGFDSPGYFSRVFKQRYEMSPSEYRKE